MRRLVHLSVLVAFIFSCGGQWYALQCVAWVKMISDYSQMVPFTTAVAMTLSGEYPCAICKAIADKKATEQSKACALEKYDKKFFPPESIAAILPATFPAEYAHFSDHLSSLTEPPPTPPPRLALS